MDFNKKIARRILLDLQNAKKLNISVKTLEKNILLNLGAIDSTFPNEIKDMLDKTLWQITEHHESQYSASLNTPQEGTYDETLPNGNLFEPEIAYLEEYVRSY